MRRWRDGLETALHAPPHGRRRVLRGVAFALSIVVILGVAGGYYFWHTIGGLRRTSLNLTQAPGRAMTVVIVGSDSRAGLTDAADVKQFGTVGGQRSDTLMLVQLIPSERRGVLISIPRDLWVTVRHGNQSVEGKINSAYSYGPQAVIDTVYALTGIPINHYIDVNFAGFRRMVDAIGGINICNSESFFDPIIGFGLSAGLHHLAGNDALQYVRTRHATVDGDFGRIKRQQEFLRAVMAKVGTPSVLGNPVKVNRLATAFARNVTVDQFFRVPDLMRLAMGLRHVGQNQLETYSVPGRIGQVGAQSVVYIDSPRSEPLFAALRQMKDPAPALSTPSPVTRAPASRAPAPSASRAPSPAAAAQPCGT